MSAPTDILDFDPAPSATDAAELDGISIGGPRGRILWEIFRWTLTFAIVGGLLVLLFIRFGATTLWAVGLVGFMLGYMALMGRWAGGSHRR